jgi:hypothetical protein
MPIGGRPTNLRLERKTAQGIAADRLRYVTTSRWRHAVYATRLVNVAPPRINFVPPHSNAESGVHYL